MLGFWCRLRVPADRRHASWYVMVLVAALWSGRGDIPTTTTLIMVSHTGYLWVFGRGRAVLEDHARLSDGRGTMSWPAKAGTSQCML